MRVRIFGLLFVPFCMFHASSPAHGQAAASVRQGHLIGAELQVSSYLGNALPTASLLFHSKRHSFSFGGELSLTLRSITDQTPHGYRRMGLLVRAGPSFGYAGSLSKQTGYYTGLTILAGVTKVEERSADVITSVPEFAVGVQPKGGLFFGPTSDLQVRVGASLWIGEMSWDEGVRVLPALTISVLK